MLYKTDFGSYVDSSTQIRVEDGAEILACFANNGSKPPSGANQNELYFEEIPNIHAVRVILNKDLFSMRHKLLRERVVGWCRNSENISPIVTYSDLGKNALSRVAILDVEGYLICTKSRRRFSTLAAFEDAALEELVGLAQGTLH